jgi:hypothetical protein
MAIVMRIARAKQLSAWHEYYFDDHTRNGNGQTTDTVIKE